ncbi:MAG: DUF3089 domain-containing protein [Acidimicrobiales bacterium]
MADPFTSSLAVTAVTATGTLKPTTWPRSTLASKFDCFYVYLTESLADTGNTALAVTKVETVTADEQAAPLSRVCDVWAPAYRSQTFPSVLKGLDSNEATRRRLSTDGSCGPRGEPPVRPERQGRPAGRLTNPAALAGSAADLRPYFLKITQVEGVPGISYGLKEAVPPPPGSPTPGSTRRDVNKGPVPPGFR